MGRRARRARRGRRERRGRRGEVEAEKYLTSHFPMAGVTPRSRRNSVMSW